MPQLQEVKRALENLTGTADVEKLKGVNATILFNVTGTEGGMWTVDIDDGEVSLEEGEPEAADVTVEATAEDLKALVKGELKPMPAFMQGRLKVKGDMSVAMQIQKLFG